MGMFDEVRHPCPCGGVFEWQTKVHDCVLKAWSLEDPAIPLVILADITSQTEYCDKCGSSATVHLVPTTRPVVEIRK